MKSLALLTLVLFLSVTTTAQSLSVSFVLSNHAGYNISCHGASDGTINAIVTGGQSPYTYSWSNSSSSQNLTSRPAGTYILTLTDSLNASLVDTVELVEPDQLTTELWTWGDISEYGGSDGVVDVGSWGGNPPYTVLWSTGQEGWMLVNVPAGLYWVISTDANGCQATDSVILNQPPGPLQVIDLSSPKHNGYEISCHGGHDGSIDLTVSGGQEPYSFQWSNGNFTEDINNLIAGDYSVMVTDANFVKFVAYITLTEPNENAIHLSTVSYPNGYCTSCSSCTDGSITASDSGGVSPRNYLWSTGQTGTVINSLGRGVYSVTVTDGNGCTASQSVELSAELEVWKIRGNSGIDTATQFIGTTDSKDLIFKTDNVERLTIKNDGSIKISPRLADDYNSTYVDINGVLRVGVYDNGQNPPNCNQPIPVWFRDVCQSAYSGKVYTYPSNLILGIGTTNPLAKLDVAGGIRSSDLAGTAGLNVVYVGTNGILQKLSPPPTSTPALSVLHGDGTWSGLPSGSNAWISNVTSNGTYINNDPLNAKIGIGNSYPHDNVEIGSLFTLHSDAQNNWIGFNNFYNSQIVKRIVDGYSSRIKFGVDGSIQLTTAASGLATSSTTIPWNKGIIINNDGHIGLNADPASSANILAHYSGMFLIDGTQSSLLIGNKSASTPYGEFGIEYEETDDNGDPISSDDLKGLNIWKPWLSTYLGQKNNILFINNRGNIGIGTDPNKLDNDDFRLSVNGGIRATMVKVYTGCVLAP